MAFGIIHYFPGGTKDNYEASIAAVHPGPGVLPDGQIFHAAGPSAGGWTITAVHESKQSWERFRDGILIPGMQAGIEVRFPLVLNTSRNRSTSSTVVVARIMMISLARIAADLGDRRPVGRRTDTLREMPWQRHRQIYPFRRWAGAGRTPGGTVDTLPLAAAPDTPRSPADAPRRCETLGWLPHRRGRETGAQAADVQRPGSPAPGRRVRSGQTMPPAESTIQVNSG